MNILFDTPKRTTFVLILTALLFVGYLYYRSTPQQTGSSSLIVEAYKSRTSNVQVEGVGKVVKVLKDDLRAPRHQRFIVRITNNLTVLIAHNIDLAPRLDTLAAGDHISFSGEYEWNPKGGVVHWTHHDPNRRHPDGWLRFEGRLYQ